MNSSRFRFFAVFVLVMGFAASVMAKPVDFKSKFEFKSCGVAKYDDFLKTTKDLIDNFDKADYAFTNVVPDVTEAVAGVYAAFGQPSPVAGADVAASLKGLMTDLSKSGMTMKVVVAGDGVDFVVVNTGADAVVYGNVNAAIGNVKAAVQTVVAIPKSVAAIVDNCKTAAGQAKDLATSAKSDFTGLKAMKLPGVVGSLNTAVDNLTKVPEKSVNLVQSVIKFVNDLKGLAS